MSSKYPSSIPDWCNLKVIHRNTLPPRASFFNYTAAKDALNYNPAASESLCLSGMWKFYHSNSPFEAPENFATPDFDVSKWSNIQVPSMWQLEGYGKPHYSNVDYPFPVDPPYVPYDNNQTGSYVRNFKVPKSFNGSQIRLRFEGVDSSFHCWVNGVEAGYSQGARNPSEFDITNLIKEDQDNTLSVRVYQFCDGSYIEDQDQWWLSGIFRDVYLLAFPQSHIQDFQIRTILDDECANAVLLAEVKAYGVGDVHLALYDANKISLVCEDKLSIKPGSDVVKFSLPVQAPDKWTAENPRLYHLVLSLGGQSIAQRVGFRKVEIKGGLILVNGKRVVFHGVNRHEHHPTMGRAVPYEFLRKDLLLMKSHNINAIRTSHQPNDTRLYDLADELGLWVMNEADLECHGFDTIHERGLPDNERAKTFEEKKAITYGRAGKWLSDNRDWEESYVDRAKQLVHRDKNHPSVIMWSLGNEAFYGRNFQAMYDWIRTVDERPVHYEGDFQAQTVDMFSLMYPPLDKMINFAESWDGKKPMLLCEYIHAMGNGPGAIKEYVNLFYRYPCLQGGWAWEWANHGLLIKNVDNEDYYAYGGDFGEYPHDGNFVMDGLVDSQHRPGPGLIEYKKAIEPVQLVEGTVEMVRIINRYDFSTLDHLECSCKVVGDGEVSEACTISLPTVLPGQTSELSIPPIIPKGVTGKAYLQLTFNLRESTPWAGAGHEVASLQIPISFPEAEVETVADSIVEITQITPTALKIKGSDTQWRFDLVKGRLSSWTKGSRDILHTGPQLSFYRALTDNDKTDGKEWLAKEVKHLSPHTRSVSWDSGTPNSSAVITCTQRIAPPALEWSIDCVITYTFQTNRVKVHVTGKPQGINLPQTLPRIGLDLSLSSDFKNTSWFGRGPGESYRDKKLSQKFGNYSAAIDDLSYEYEFPQESGNHTETDVVRFDGEGVSFTAKFLDKSEGFDFQASHYDVLDVDKARHPYELRKMRKDEVIVRLDADHHGLGTDSCGPKTLPQYALKTAPFEFTVLLE